MIDYNLIQQNILSNIPGIISSIITGIISGIVASVYYSEVQQYEKNLIEFKEDRYKRYEYSRRVHFEISLVIEEMEREEPKNIDIIFKQGLDKALSKGKEEYVDELKRLLNNYPKFEGFSKVKITEESQEIINEEYTELLEITDKINKNEFDLSYLRHKKAKFARIKIGLLKVKCKKNSPWKKWYKLIGAVIVLTILWIITIA